MLQVACVHRVRGKLLESWRRLTFFHLEVEQLRCSCPFTRGSFKLVQLPPHTLAAAIRVIGDTNKPAKAMSTVTMMCRQGRRGDASLFRRVYSLG
jgi:hypothetical protein